MSKSGAAPDIARLIIQDDEEDLFASPESGATTQKHTPSSNSNSAQKRSSSHHNATEEREAQLRAELERVREVNRVIEGVTASLEKAKENMGTVHNTVNNASTLLATWTRILSQTEHNQRLILNPTWQGAGQDVEDAENEEVRRQAEAERRVAEEQRRREEAQRRAEEEERRRAVAESKPAGRGVSRTRSTRGGVAGTGRGPDEGEELPALQKGAVSVAEQVLLEGVAEDERPWPLRQNVQLPPLTGSFMDSGCLFSRLSDNRDGEMRYG